MKKITIILALVLMISMLAGCAGSSQAGTTASEPSSDEEVTAEGEGSLAGGWTLQDADPVLGSDEKAVFEKACEQWTGTGLEPIAVIATQVVAGTNYCFLAKATTVTAAPEEYYTFVYVYEDLEGNAQISGTRDIVISSDAEGDEGESTEGLAGGWTLAELDGITVSNQEVLEKALEQFVGSKLAPIACLATQVVSGTNYCFIVKETLVTAQPVSYIALVYVYQDLEGNAEISAIQTIDYMPE